MICWDDVCVVLPTSQMAGFALSTAVTCTPPDGVDGPGPCSRTCHTPVLTAVTVFASPAELNDVTVPPVVWYR
jgi:hypothetical protein